MLIALRLLWRIARAAHESFSRFHRDYIAPPGPERRLPRPAAPTTYPCCPACCSSAECLDDHREPCLTFGRCQP